MHGWMASSEDRTNRYISGIFKLSCDVIFDSDD